MFDPLLSQKAPLSLSPWLWDPCVFIESETDAVSGLATELSPQSRPIQSLEPELCLKAGG